MDFALLLPAILGHAFLWIGLTNRLHGVSIPRKILHRITLAFFGCMGVIPLGIGVWCIENSTWPTPWAWRGADNGTQYVIGLYVALCWAVAAITLVRLVWIRFRHRRPAIVRFYERQRASLDLAAAATEAADHTHHAWTRLPLNEVLQLDVQRWTLDVPRLPAALDGLSIMHLSDSHFTGRVGKAFFAEVVRVANDLRPDVACITGDIIDEAECFDWIADTLGRLSARYGVYFILGNHDRRVDSERVRRELSQCGLVDLGGRVLPIDIRGTPVLLAGNERPWFNPAPTFADSPRAFRIALTHTPDHFDWARHNDVDLLLAGHTHGGQIRIPPLGAIFSPTAGGVKYIAGVFHVPPTILHVSRGVSGDVPIRWNCRPELSLLQLRAEPTRRR